MRPEFLRYIGTLEIRIGELEKSLQEKRVERHEAKKRLALIRTNCEKIREIMEKYIGSRAASETDLKSNDAMHRRENNGVNKTVEKSVKDQKEINEIEILNIKHKEVIRTTKMDRRTSEGKSEHADNKRFSGKTVTTPTNTSDKTKINKSVKKDDKTPSTTEVERNQHITTNKRTGST